MKQNLSQRHREGVAFRKTREGPLQRSGVLHYKSRPPLLQWSGAPFHGETVSNSEHVSCSVVRYFHVVHVAEDLFIRKCLLSKYFYPYTTE